MPGTPYTGKPANTFANDLGLQRGPSSEADPDLQLLFGKVADVLPGIGYDLFQQQPQIFQGLSD